MAEQPEGYEIVLPFTVVTSAGGPYEDQAFVAGFQAGSIDVDLRVGMPQPEYWVPSALVPQLDLIAMRRGYLMEHEPWADDVRWSRIEFRLPDEPA